MEIIIFAVKTILHMKRILSIFAFIFSVGIVNAQDIITLNDGTDIKVKVLEANESSITYIKLSNPDGPRYTTSLSEILMVTYENGAREMYNTPSSNQRSESIPHGVMTYNERNGKISVGGRIIDNEMMDMYFSAQDMELYRKGKTMSTIGGVIGCIAAVPFGYNAGYLLGAGELDDNQKNVMIASGICLVGGLAISMYGERHIKTAISNYNHNMVSLQPKLQFMATPYDISLGIALAF